MSSLGAIQQRDTYRDLTSPLPFRIGLPTISRIAFVSLILVVLTQVDSADAGFWGAIGKGLKVATKAVEKAVVITAQKVFQCTCVVVDKLLESAINNNLQLQVDIPLGKACGAE